MGDQQSAVHVANIVGKKDFIVGDNKEICLAVCVYICVTR